MKKSLLAFTIGAAMAVPATATAHTQLYGKINLSLDKVEPYTPLVHWASFSGSDEHHWQLNSNKSYLGVRGATDLDVADMEVIFQLEFGTSVDEGNLEKLSPGSSSLGLDTFTTRNSFLGLKTNFGTLKAGRFDTPLRELGIGVDQFHDQLYADNFNLMAGEWRASNVIQYSTPQIAELLTFNVATVVSELDDVNSSGTGNAGVFDSYSTSLLFDAGLFHAGIAYDHNNYGATLQNGVDLSVTRPSVLAPVTGVNPDGLLALDIIRLAGGVNFDVIEFGVLLQEAETREDVDVSGGAGTDFDVEKERTWMVSAGIPLGAVKLKAQYGETDPEETDDAKVRQYSLGADYALGRQTKAYAYGSNQDVDGDRRYAVAGIGLEHRF
ncbi:MAG: porin [Pseudomonadota bacterium]|nr:porin [Pseudomonadota bacterium]